MILNVVSGLLGHRKVRLLKDILRVLSLNVPEVKAETDEHSQRHFLICLHLLASIRGQGKDVTDEATHMIVLQVLEFFGRQDVRQEPEDLHVNVLDLVMRRLQRGVPKRHDARGNAHIPRLLTLVLKMDHRDRNLRSEAHLLELRFIKDFISVG